MNDVFLSYASEDRDRVEPLAKALQSRGFSVWWDPHILPGDIWRQTIDQALTQAACVVVVWSAASVSSQWVQAEAEEARKRGILVPVLIDAVKVPLVFRTIQTADFVGWSPRKKKDPKLDTLCEAVSNIIKNRPEAVAAESPDQPLDSEPAPSPHLKPVKQYRRFLLYGVLGILAILFAVYLSGQPWRRASPPAQDSTQQGQPGTKTPTVPAQTIPQFEGDQPQNEQSGAQAPEGGTQAVQTDPNPEQQASGLSRSLFKPPMEVGSNGERMKRTPQDRSATPQKQ